MIHRGYDFAQIVDYFAFGTEGIYGTPVYVSAAYIFIFVVFAAFLERAGMIALFNDFALGLVGSWRGGPAQVCVLSSALMGTISGSGVANVVASGQFTIPLMKRFGFRSAFAGAVEATSSMGGQIMPPVMGAVAFIMAETLNIPYAEVVKAAIIPAILYFGACFWQVHLEAGKAGLRGMDKEELPNPWDAVQGALAAGAAARRARLSVVCRLYADLRRHHGSGADRRADPRRAARRAHRAVRLPRRVLDRARPRRGRLHAVRREHPGARHRRARAGLPAVQGRPRDAADLRRLARRGRQERAARSASPAPSSASSSARSR